MTKTELESKHLADLHRLAAAAGVERFRMLSRAELIERLSDDDGEAGGAAPRSAEAGEGHGRPRRRRRRVAPSGREREERTDVEDEEEKPPESTAPGRAPTPAPRERDEEAPRPRRRRRRRRFGRRREDVTIQDLLLPAESGRQAVLVAAGREAATELLRGVAADLAGASDGPDPVALLIDPSPEELADWKREAPQAELVSAGQARHAADALAAAQRRAADGEDVILLVDSLTRLVESFGDPDGAKELFDAGRAQAASGKGSLTVLAALERS